MKMKLILAAATLTLLPACFNNVGGNGGTTAASTSSGTGTKTSAGAGGSFTIVAVTVTNPSSSSSSSSSSSAASATPPTAAINFNAVTGGKNLTDVCQVQGAGGSPDPHRACRCRYTWAETNLSDSSTVNRSADTAPTLITNFQTQCPVPNVWTNEIPDSTIVSVSLVPDTTQGNNSGFKVAAYQITKTTSGFSGDFRDAEGRTYKNVFHYSCFDKTQKALTITHKLLPAVTQTGGSQMQVYAPVANEYDIGTNQSSVYSAQSYYYDFYVRSNEWGSINDGNQFFSCPKVNIGGIPQYFPLDSSFAVALSASKDFNVPVTAAITLATTGGDPNAASTNPADNSILGFAAKPNSDGTCPAFLDSNSNVRRTFRLRQYSAVYPIRFNANGDPLDKAQPVNVVYVLDRPVDKSGQDPMKPITRLGPKPCPFSYKTQQFGYKCSSDATLNGWSVDGTQVNGDPGCPIYPPPPNQYMKMDGTLVIRPYKPFVPHYLENTTYKACAFQSSAPVDPEIVLSHDDNVFSTVTGPNDFYCAKHYPAAGAIIPPPNGDPFDKPPSECDLASSANAIKTDITYACSKTYDPFNGTKNTPQAGCCQICSGPNCTAQGGGTLPAGRNAAFSPPQNVGNPPVAFKTLTRGTPNSNASGCFDPTEP